MRFMQFNTLYSSMFLLSGFSISGATWAQVQEPVALPTIKVEATRTDTTYLQTPASVFALMRPSRMKAHRSI